MFKTKNALQSHGIVHNNIRTFRCEECLGLFKTAIALRIHISIVHPEKKSFSCETCLKSFGLASQLKRHKFQVHAPKIRSVKKTFKCNKCDFVTNAQHNSSGLNIHKKTMHMEKTGTSKKCHDCTFESTSEWKMYQHKLKINFHKTEQ